ncbi:hypothetical protein [Hymenobacter yonginensis]|uniref:Uncharacterized protein n=1 Tax=Hymenobacter yonginensis TaxID=748197 RepID=A0ABY7PTA9_9BACT|nr:hypothetical protein [Hymenobacter yonginensis]WBO86147.1 hypothetical protein O9Z63_07785 [Hymenobacter yonginensis]
MDTAASLAFFQNFYTDVSLYVVPDSQPAAPAESAVAPAASALPQAVAAAAAPVAANPAPAAAAKPTVQAAPALPATPQPAPVAAAVPPTPAPPVPAPAPAPVVPPVKVPVDAGPLFNSFTLAELPAAPVAPPSQPGRVQPTPTQSPVAHIPFSTMGSNPNGLLILVRVSPDEFRKLPRNVFLNNILKAIRLVMEDVVLVNVEHEKFPVALCSLRQHLAARQFLAFGKNLLDVAVYTTQPYEPVLLYGDTAFLGASEIKMLEYDAGRKKQLWQSMQRMFLG